MVLPIHTQAKDTINYKLLMSLLFCPLLWYGCAKNLDIPPPEYDPGLINPIRVIKAEPIPVQQDSIISPDTLILTAKKERIQRIEYVQEPTKEVELAFTKVPSRGRVINMQDFDPPQQRECRGSSKPTKWPQWRPVALEYSKNSLYPMAYLTNENGLEAGGVDCAIEDSKGWIWIGTYMGGISVYDGIGIRRITADHGLNGNSVWKVMEDSQDRIWMVVRGQGVNMYDGERMWSFTDKEGLSHRSASCIMEDKFGRILIGTTEGLNILDGEKLTILTNDNGLSNNSVHCITQNSKGDIIMGTGSGLTIWDGTHFKWLTTKEGLTVDGIRSLYCDSKDQIWIGTRGGGLNMWDGQNVYQYHTKEINIHAITEDQSGNIWFGGNLGVHVWNGTKLRNISTDEGLKDRAVHDIMQQPNGRIWICNVDGGANILLNQDLQHFAYDNGTWYGIGGFGGIAESQQGVAWVSGQLLKSIDMTEKRSLLNVYTGNPRRFNVFTRSDDPIKLFFRRRQFFGYFKLDEKGMPITSFMQFELPLVQNINSHRTSNENYIWLSTRINGIFKWGLDPSSPQKAVVTHYSTASGLLNDKINSTMIDHDNSLWVGTNAGINVIHADGSIEAYDVLSSESNNAVVGIGHDQLNRMWFGCENGSIAILQDGGFYQYSFRNPAEWLIPIVFLSSEKASVWLGTNKGLYKLTKTVDSDQLHVKKYSEFDGIKQSTIGHLHIDKNQHLWISKGKGGLDVVNIKSLETDQSKPAIRFAEVQPLYEEVDWRQVDSQSHQESTSNDNAKKKHLANIKYETVIPFSNIPGKARFPYNVNDLYIRWQGIFWENPELLQYSIYLEGRDESWSPLLEENYVTMNDLRPGAYTLKVRAVGDNAQWSDTASYAFVIKPPIWQTTFAYIFYGLCIIGIGAIIRYYERKRFVMQQRNLTLQEMDKLKSEFFTNITHEFRTPLTLMLGPLKSLRQGNVEGDKNDLLDMMIRNGQRLLRLINQLLDLSKLERKSLSLELSECNLNELMRLIVANFESAAFQKKIELTLTSMDHALVMNLDREKFERIMFNLLGNALKFTPEGGKVGVIISEAKDNGNMNSERPAKVRIIVKDSGIGIPASELPKIFDRFHQVDRSKTKRTQGSGLGLALTKELVQLHKGTISVDSEEGWGTTFTIELPTNLAGEDIDLPANTPRSIDQENVVPPSTEIDIEAVIDESEITAALEETNEKQTILLVEDNIDMRTYIRQCLGSRFAWLESGNGKDALEIANKDVPDLILSDVMMPEMDGYAFCKEIRSRLTTRHIPLIFLSARGDVDSKITGLEYGADDYLVKPFDEKELKLKVQNQISRLNNSKQVFSQLITQVDNTEVSESADSSWLQSAIEIVENRIDDHTFTIEQFSEAAAMSQTQLYRKLTALTGQSPNKFVRSIRLKKAAQLLSSQRGNVSQVAYAVGFNNLSYFARSFKKQFGVTPLDYTRNAV